ncbi:response regulator [Muricoccus radiodurans]|uniref:response regulator n=1 Tax=Muricoccus radiodurans TaxID=2231721 RepID=UPI003CF652EE
MCPGNPAPARTASVPATQQDAADTLSPLAGRRVLVVEDEYFLADDLANALQQSGAEVLGPVPTPSQALALLTKGAPPDAAVLDVNLRGEMIYPVADALRDRGVPFVFATGYDQTAIPTAYQAVPHWEKPHNPRELIRALSSLLAGR